MMKKLFSLTLAMVTALGLMLPASAAEETTDEALARVTQAVKAALDLDTDAYDEFQGSWYEDGLTGAWDLYWSTELEEELSISALDDGTVISYDLGLPYTASNSGISRSFPQGDEAAAARAAGDFLDKVLREGESVKLEEPRGMDILGGDSYRYSGVILLNGLPSPLTYSITVDAADNRVRSFHRTTAGGHLPGRRPSAAAAVRRDRAAKLLTDTLELKLEYVREAGGTSAVLRYLPVDTDTFYVDAATGALLNLTELEDQMGGWGAGGSADNTAAAESEDSGLSPAEQAGIAQMEGVRSSAFLDQSLRAEPVYGLTEYALSSAAYRLAEQEGKEDQVLCVLSYVRPGGGTAVPAPSQWMPAPARSRRCSPTHPEWRRGRHRPLTQAEAQVKAETFLSALCGGRWSALTLYDGRDNTEDRRPYYTFTYVQQVAAFPSRRTAIPWPSTAETGPCTGWIISTTRM